jgi:hypothetical protein
MLHIFLFLILSSSVCIYSKQGWEDLIDRLDLLFTQSYLIIQCNEEEIQIIRSLNTFEELNSKMKCTNKDTILQHKNDRVQIVNLAEITVTCEKNQVIQMTGRFDRIKKSLKKDQNGVEWPYIHTHFTKEIEKTDPIKMKFLDDAHINIILTQIDVNEFKDETNIFSIYLDFVNRPMACRIVIPSIKLKKKDGSCNSIDAENCRHPICYYKVNLIYTFYATLTPLNLCFNRKQEECHITRNLEMPHLQS